jgi:hypothetical protein
MTKNHPLDFLKTPKSVDGCSESRAKQASLRKRPSRNYSAAVLLLACSGKEFQFFSTEMVNG